MSINIRKRFVNGIHKQKEILNVIRDDEMVTLDEIHRRLLSLGYDIDKRHLAMYIRYNLLHKDLIKIRIGKKTYYAKKVKKLITKSIQSRF